MSLFHTLPQHPWDTLDRLVGKPPPPLFPLLSTKSGTAPPVLFLLPTLLAPEEGTAAPMLQLSCPAEKTRHTHTHTRKAEAAADSLSFPLLPPCTEGAKLGVGTFVGIPYIGGGMRGSREESPPRRTEQTPASAADRHWLYRCTYLSYSTVYYRRRFPHGANALMVLTIPFQKKKLQHVGQ